MTGKPFQIAAFLAVAGLLALVPQLGSEYWLGVAFIVAMWIALIQSWSLLSATTGYISLGHAVFYGIGAYVLVVSLDWMPVPYALLLSGAAAGMLALVVGLPVLRVKGPYFVILTFGFAELVKNLVMLVETRLGQFSRMIFDAPSLEALYYAMLALAVIATALAAWTAQSRFGRGLAAIRENEVAAEAIGVPVTRLKLIAFVASAIIPGIVGGLLVLRTSYFAADQAFDPAVSFTIVTTAIVGGLGRVSGPLLGTLFLVILSELLWARFPQAYMMILGALLIVFILFVPQGLAGLVRKGLGRA